MSISRLPLISIDLYRTMVNPFLNFKASVRQYDIGLLMYSFSIVVVFASVVRAKYKQPGLFKMPDSTSTEPGSFSNGTCSALEQYNVAHPCFSMAGPWTMGKDTISVNQPKFCFVPNRSKNPLYGSRDTSPEFFIFPIFWLYLQLFLSTFATVLFSYLSYRRLITGTSESIAARFPIILANFRNIFTQVYLNLTSAVVRILTCCPIPASVDYSDRNAQYFNIYTRRA